MILLEKAKTKTGDKIIKEIVTIGDWMKSCRNQEQLDAVNDFLNSKKWVIPSIDSAIISFHLGVVRGISLTIEKRKAYK